MNMLVIDWLSKRTDFAGPDAIFCFCGHIVKARVFFIFRFTDPPDPIFWKLKKIKEFFFNFIFLFPSDSCQYSNGVQLCFFILSFLLLQRLIKLPPVTVPGEILPF